MPIVRTKNARRMEENFLESPKIVALGKKMAENGKKKRYSDIQDEAGNQYIDLVMQGGGVLGISLVGYIYALEKAGLRIMGVAGTSAGSIVALMLAAQRDYSSEKSKAILQLLQEIDISTFTDGKKSVRSFLRNMLSKSSRFSMLWQGTWLLNDMYANLGLNPGQKFYAWVRDSLSNFGVHSLKDLMDIRDDFPKLYRPNGTLIPREQLHAPLAIIAADITTESKVVFPKMAPLYWKNYEQVNPANFVRASMSIPFIFQPYVINKVPHGREAEMLWKQYTNYTGPLPEQVHFTDGGIISNFPINIFHRPDRVPLKPTFGVKLEQAHNRYNKVTSPLKYIKAVFNSSRNALDNEFINNNKEYKQLISVVNTGHHSWLNFDMKEKDKLDLFERGMESALEFLDTFDWEVYKSYRIRELGQ